MKKYKLGFISDEDFFNHVKETVQHYRVSISLKDFNKNLVDPIKLSFDSKIYGKSLEEIIDAEIIRQVDKSNTNHIGYFHQNIFKYIGGGWHVPDTGYDVINTNRNIYVELKNKHNTMNSASSQKTYIMMQNTLLRDDKATCMLVEVIAKNSQNKPWTVSIDGTQMSHRKIRRISIDKFYEIVTNDKNAFKKLCVALPKAIGSVVDEIGKTNIKSSVIDELKKLSPNLLKSIFLLSFSKYDGFDKFKV